MNELDKKEAPDMPGASEENKAKDTDLDLSFFDKDRLRQRSRSRIKGKRAAAGSRSRGGAPMDRSRLIFVSAAAIILILIIAALFALLRNGGKTDPDNGGAEIQDVSMAPATASAMDDSRQAETLRACDIPEISMLIDSYFSCRLSADAEGLYALFGREPDQSMDLLSEKLRAEASWIQSFNDVAIWLAAGLDGDSKVCFVTYSVNFRRTDTNAPGIMYFYVEKDENGSYIIDESLDSEKLTLINSLLSEPEVEEMVTETDNELSNVLGYDSDLALIYTAFTDGSIYEESSYDPEREPEVNLFIDPQDSVLVATPSQPEQPEVSEGSVG